MVMGLVMGSMRGSVEEVLDRWQRVPASPHGRSELPACQFGLINDVAADIPFILKIYSWLISLAGLTGWLAG